MHRADHYRQCRSKKRNISTAVASNTACVTSLHCHLLPCVRHEEVYPGIVCARHLAGQTQKPASAALPSSGSTAHQQAAAPVLGHAAPSGGQQGAMMVHQCHWDQPGRRQIILATPPRQTRITRRKFTAMPMPRKWRAEQPAWLRRCHWHHPHSSKTLSSVCALSTCHNCRTQSIDSRCASHEGCRPPPKSTRLLRPHAGGILARILRCACAAILIADHCSATRTLRCLGGRLRSRLGPRGLVDQVDEAAEVDARVVAQADLARATWSSRPCSPPAAPGAAARRPSAPGSACRGRPPCLRAPGVAGRHYGRTAALGVCLGALHTSWDERNV